MNFTSMFQSFEVCTEAEKNKFGFILGESVNFAGHHPFSYVLLDGTTPTNETHDHEFLIYSKICYPCIGTTPNVNLSGHQKELLFWHWKLEISMYHIQELMQPVKTHESSGICNEVHLDVNSVSKSTPDLKTHPL